MRISGAALFGVALAALAGFAVYKALSWPPKAALFPLVMGIPLLVLALAQVILDPMLIHAATLELEEVTLSARTGET